MANRSLFQSLRGALLPKTDAVNDAGAPAYALGPQAALAQLAATGCLNSTYYASGKMLRNFVQILRSGVTGRKSLGTAPKRLIHQWLERASVRHLLQASVGTAPSLADIVKMVHPHPADPAREAFYAWLIGKPWNPEALPESVSVYEAWKQTRAGAVPDVPFQLLTALDLGTAEWSAIAGNASWQTTRMNLNTFARHGGCR
jgi:60 kDa SS-A/Ro ribonucleoprotein